MKPDDTNQVTWSQDGHPYSGRFGDTFYSAEDGRAETDHVFINGNRLHERWPVVADFKIGELGFGTGLNFVETWQQWRRTRRPDQSLSFFSVEAYPLNADEIETALDEWPDLKDLAKVLIENWPDCQNKTVTMDEQTNLTVVVSDVLDAIEQFPTDIDCWYLDGFSPAKNPDMWSTEVMSKIAKDTATNGTFASYTSAGWVRRNLESAGFRVEKCPGFGRKRHMISGYLETLA